MIILRKRVNLKELIFGKRDLQGNDPLPSPLFLPDPKIEEKYGKIKSIVENTNKYNKDQQKLGVIDKNRLKQLRKEIIKNKKYYDNGTDSSSDTHYLKNLTKHPSESHLLSKSINGVDRLIYRVYKPRLVEDEETKEVLYIQKIVFESCFGHDTNGQGKY